MAAWLVSVLFCALAGSTVLADDRLTFPELAPVAPGTVGNRIVSGWESELGQFPHQLSLRLVSPAGAVSACGGTIISAEWGLTAAHCTAGRVTVVIRAGTVNLTLPTYIFDTTKYYNHPLYNEAMQSVVQPHDIGLLEFGRSLVLNEFVKPIRLQRSSAKDYNYEGELLIASGWGRTWTDGASPENMNWVYQYGVSNQQCLSAFGGSSIIVDSTICSRYFNVTSQSTCQGDSGGCLAHRDEDGELSQVGVTSFVSAMGCHVGMPAGFIRPGHYHAWFTEVSGQNFDWELEEPEVPTTAVPEGGDSSASSEEEDEPSPSSEEDSESSPSSEEDSESSPSSEEDSEPSPSSEEDSEPSPSSEEDNESSASSGGNDEE